MTKQVCSQCKGEKIYFDAYSNVNDPQDVITYDDVFCMDCEESVSTEDADDAEDG